MSEVKREVKCFEKRYICDECNKGEMEAERVLMSNPPQYVLCCNNCGRKFISLVQYPQIVFE